MPSQMLIRVNPDIKNKFIKLSRIEGKNASQKIRELIEEYVRDHDLGAYAGELWDSIHKKMTSRGVTKKNIGAAIKEVRRHK